MHWIQVHAERFHVLFKANVPEFREASASQPGTRVPLFLALFLALFFYS